MNRKDNNCISRRHIENLPADQEECGLWNENWDSCVVTQEADRRGGGGGKGGQRNNKRKV